MLLAARKQRAERANRLSARAKFRECDQRTRRFRLATRRLDDPRSQFALAKARHNSPLYFRATLCKNITPICADARHAQIRPQTKSPLRFESKVSEKRFPASPRVLQQTVSSFQHAALALLARRSAVRSFASLAPRSIILGAMWFRLVALRRDHFRMRRAVS